MASGIPFCFCVTQQEFSSDSLNEYTVTDAYFIGHLSAVNLQDWWAV